jgi:hypothetical protein
VLVLFKDKVTWLAHKHQSYSVERDRRARGANFLGDVNRLGIGILMFTSYEEIFTNYIMFIFWSLQCRQQKRWRIAVGLCLLILLDEFCVKTERLYSVPFREVSHWNFERSPVTFVDNPKNDVGKCFFIIQPYYTSYLTLQVRNSLFCMKS